ncbi:MAG: hypothetical protein U0694_06415 [Anaerolineae bacterium]
MQYAAADDMLAEFEAQHPNVDVVYRALDSGPNFPTRRQTSTRT